jgi:hypothetical protein
VKSKKYKKGPQILLAGDLSLTEETELGTPKKVIAETEGMLTVLMKSLECKPLNFRTLFSNWIREEP